jgi:hypothetical protein
MNDGYTWAAEEFGSAKLGDVRRTVRLVEMAAACAEQPAGVVTRVVRTLAEREGAYRFLESKRINDAAISKAMFAASARRCSASRSIIVAVDQSTISIVDRDKTKGLGRTGTVTHNVSRRGFEVMSALAMLPDSQITGLLAQEWLIRSDERSPDRHHDSRPLEQRESALWHRCLESMVATLREHAPQARPWVQMDRGADIGHVLQSAVRLGIDFTIRSSFNRSLEPLGYLRDVLQKSRALGCVKLELRDSHASNGVARTRKVNFVVRARRLPIRLQTTRGKIIQVLPLTVVHIREVVKGLRKPIEWYLLTNRPAKTLAEALEVVLAYRLRWRVEDFHRAWKGGVCDVERSQLRSPHALRRWATLLAAVAVRAERLKTTSRATPDADATTEFSPDEIDAAIILSKTNKFKRGDELTLEQAVELVAFVGGYTGRKNSGGPPGTTVISRGLHDVMVAANAIAALKSSG